MISYEADEHHFILLGVIGLVFKIIWDWLQARKANGHREHDVGEAMMILRDMEDRQEKNVGFHAAALLEIPRIGNVVAGQIQLVPPIDQSMVSRLLLRMQSDDANNRGDRAEMPGLLSAAELEERKQWCWYWCE